MLDADIDSFFDVSIADSLVDDDADGGFRDVVNHTGFAMVDFMGHAFLDGSICFDVDDISHSGQ